MLPIIFQSKASNYDGNNTALCYVFPKDYP